MDRLNDPAGLPKWLAVTAARESLKILRNQTRSPSLENLEEVLATEEAEAERIAADGLETAAVMTALERLGGRCEKLLRMLYVDELSYQEIAIQGFAMGSIGPSRARCLEKLRTLVLRAGAFDVSSKDTQGSFKT